MDWPNVMQLMSHDLMSCSRQTNPKWVSNTNICLGLNFPSETVDASIKCSWSHICSTYMKNNPARPNIGFKDHSHAPPLPAPLRCSSIIPAPCFKKQKQNEAAPCLCFMLFWRPFLQYHLIATRCVEITQHAWVQWIRPSPWCKSTFCSIQTNKTKQNKM